ncbi:hypothetical protein EI94DRAFT_1702516 [Lactarius quietus]|nr:hypothetical protein EI94DRAFT_1702516 [Lactarius quietus]
MDKGLRTVLVLKFSNKATFQCRNNWNSLPHGSHSICPTSLPFVTRDLVHLQRLFPTWTPKETVSNAGPWYTDVNQAAPPAPSVIEMPLFQWDRGKRCEAVPPPGQNAFHARRQAPAHPPPPPSKCLGDTARKVALATPSRRIPTQGIQGSQGIQKTSIVKWVGLGLVIKEEHGKVGRHIGPHSHLLCCAGLVGWLCYHDPMVTATWANDNCDNDNEVYNSAAFNDATATARCTTMWPTATRQQRQWLRHVATSMLLGPTLCYWLVIHTGNPGFSEGNPYLYPPKTHTCDKGTGTRTTVGIKPARVDVTALVLGVDFIVGIWIRARIAIVIVVRLRVLHFAAVVTVSIGMSLVN